MREIHDGSPQILSVPHSGGEIDLAADPGLEVADTFDGALDGIEAYFEREWTDGLPVVPVTEERLRRVLATVERDPEEELGEVPPRMGVATVRNIAINAVLAGCRPDYFPVVLAATEAVLKPSFNLNAIQATTSPCAPLIVVSGPIGEALGFNSGYNCFGQGARANATVGRALRLVMSNLGGGRPGTGDKATLGQPAKYSFCVAESPNSPWAPLSADLGMPEDQSAVTVFACTYHVVGASGVRTDASQAIGEPRPDLEILGGIVHAVQCDAQHNLIVGGQIGVVFNPHMARVLAEHGWDKNDIRLYLYENARAPISSIPLEIQIHGDDTDRWPRWFDACGLDSLIPFARRPEDYLILCCGDAYRGWSALLTGWGYAGGNAHVAAIAQATPG